MYRYAGTFADCIQSRDTFFRAMFNRCDHFTEAVGRNPAHGVVCCWKYGCGFITQIHIGKGQYQVTNGR